MKNVVNIAFPLTLTRMRLPVVALPLLILGSACTGGEPEPLPGTGGASTGAGGMVYNAGGYQGVGGEFQGAGGVFVAAGGNFVGSGGSAEGGGGMGGEGGGGGGEGGNTSSGGALEPAACSGDLPNTPADGADHSVVVDGTDSWGDLPHFWNTFGTGHLGLYLRDERGWGETLKANTIDGVRNLGLTSLRQHGLFHDDIGIYHEEDGVPVYDFRRSDLIFDFLVGNGIEPIIELAPMPRDLAADPTYTVFDWNMIVSQPKDYERWQELVFKFVEHSIERYTEEVVSKWYFEVWNEPECCNNKFWAGSLEEYQQLYDYAAAGVRAALPNGRVGGPVTSQPQQLVGPPAAGTAFLDHVLNDNYLTPGEPGILDFFTYHSWSFVDGSVGGYFEGLDLLDSYGLNDMGIAITEFGPTWEFGLVEEPQEMHQGAAFVVQTYSDISQRCAKENKRFPIAYSWWVLDDIFEEGLYFEEDPFIGCMGLTTRENIRKPVYNAYTFLAQMGDEQLNLSVSGAGDVGGMAARDGEGGVQIIVYNGQNPGPGPSGMDSSTQARYYDESEAHEISLSISGLPADLAYDVTAYRVDETRGNAYATWQGQGRPKMSEMSEDDWQALRDTMISPAEPIGEALCGDTFAQSFSLTSPGVLFVTLTPALR